MAWTKNAKRVWIYLLIGMMAQTMSHAQLADTCSSSDGSSCTQSDIVTPRGANAAGKPPDVDLSQCFDREIKRCLYDQKRGECERNPGWMIVNCPVACKACHLLDPKVRCNRERLNISSVPAFQPGELDNMFLNIPLEFRDRYEVNIISTSPWIVSLDGFLDDREVDAIVSFGSGRWERSTDTGVANSYGETGRVLSTSRTSSNAWYDSIMLLCCRRILSIQTPTMVSLSRCRDECEGNPHVQSVMNKIDEVTKLPRENSESFQVFRRRVAC
jgi:hypothetical protein